MSYTRRYSPFFHSSRLFDEPLDFDRPSISRPYWADKPLMESHRFGEGVGPAPADSAEEVHVQIDVSHFRPEDLKVNVVDDWIVIEGRHEQKADKYGQIERNFVRKVKLPSGVKPEDVTSELSVDGILTVQAEKPRPQEDSRVRHIPIRSKH